MATKLAFTTLRGDQGDVLFWQQHWQRLDKSWQFFKATHLNGKKELRQRLIELFKNKSDLIIRVDLLDDQSFELNSRPLTCNDSEPQLKLKLSDEKLKDREKPAWLKAGDYSERMQKREEIRKLGFDDFLYLGSDGYVAEASVANIVWLKNEKFYAPKESKYILQGIMTMMLQASASVAFESSSYELQQVLQADALWLVNAVTGPQRIISIDDRNFDRKVPQVDLVQLYWQLVKKDRDKRGEENLNN